MPRDTAIRSPEEVLHEVFGHGGFRGRQAEVVNHVVAGGSGLVLMPTGGGKSLCFQVPALCRPGLAIVVSPLIALMEDQVAALRQQGVAAAALHSELEEEERRAVWRDILSGQLKLLYVSPERLSMEGMLERLASRSLALFAIDEAHCISQWGHHFRPEYRALTLLHGRFPEVPRIALTATADGRTVEDIRRLLDLQDAPVFRSSFDRPNIHLAAAPRESERQQLRAFLRRVDGTGIVYCGTRNKAEQTAEWLRNDGHDALAFHAGMDTAAKREAHRRFARGEEVIMCATIAFGMGIDRPDVRFVAHLALPQGPEGWYQEIGRAGRDGLPARALLLYGAGDIALSRHRIAESPAGAEQKRIERARLDAMVAIAESATCRRRTLLRCFGEELEKDCGACDVCMNPPRLVDATVAAQKLISAAVRTGSRFGLGHLVDVLRGRMTDKIAQFGHDRLPTFGKGKDVAEGAWKDIARQLVAEGALDVAVENFGELVPTEAARPLLRGERAFLLRESSFQPRAAREDRVAPPSDDPVFGALREWRKEEARKQQVPAYVIFHDQTLAEIASRHPRSLDELREVPGVGESKLNRYGAAVLSVLESVPA
ncbi:DNA helicase RecQ [Sabulicella rubraurantiaca]|uniref:DNA helicase RecQ n=1 Tax=Sabulicella rubraurantiaca TaxID=2811429 RepID=UPI001A956C8F|nr:DNA helicase RecQ [Sabulicella rubraurantiaca]